MINGLYFWEIFMLIGGGLLCLVSIGLLVASFIKRRNMKAILPYLAASIVMIGFSSFKKIQYENGVIAVEMNQKAAANNPQDPEIRKDLTRELAAISDRPTTDPKVLLSIAQGQAAVGDTTRAEHFLNAAASRGRFTTEMQAFGNRIRRHPR